MVAYASTWPMTCTSTGTSLLDAVATVTGTSPPPPFLPPLAPPGAAPVEPAPEHAIRPQRRKSTIPACIRIQKSFGLGGGTLPRSKRLGIKASVVLGDTTHVKGYRSVAQGARKITKDHGCNRSLWSR